MDLEDVALACDGEIGEEARFLESASDVVSISEWQIYDI